jgi:septal ring factor EnvC (AmiA/AmiB activator)
VEIARLAREMPQFLRTTFMVDQQLTTGRHYDRPGWNEQVTGHDLLSDTGKIIRWLASGILAFGLIGSSLLGAAESRLGEPSRESKRRALQSLTRNIAVSAERRVALEREIKALDKDNSVLNKALIKAAARATVLEEEIIASEERLMDLGADVDRIRLSLNQRQTILTGVLAVLQRMGTTPPPAVLVQPEDALATLRSAMLMNALIPDIRREAKALSADLTELSALRNQADKERNSLHNVAQRLAEERRRVELLIAEKRKRRKSSASELIAERTRSKELAAEAKSMSELIGKLEKEIKSARTAAQKARDSEEAARKRSKATGGDAEKKLALLADPSRIEPAIPFVDAKGLLKLPVRGVTLRSFGDNDAFDGKSAGISLATRANAQISAPCDGWVVYAGPFRSYGQLLILNAGNGYHVLLAGMDRMDVELGQFVLTGEPVALMGRRQLASAATLDIGSAQPILYIEFRKDGVSIDPAPWWALTTDKKVRG